MEDALKRELPNANIERHAIQLERPIKETGAHEIPVKLYTDVTATLKVNVKSATEAVAPAETPAAPAAEEKKGPSKYAAKKKS